MIINKSYLTRLYVEKKNSVTRRDNDLDETPRRRQSGIDAISNKLDVSVGV